MSNSPEGVPASGESGVHVELPLPFPELSGDLPLLPARMVNEYEYCPRLAYLEWVQGEWADSSDTVEGRHAHRRVDRASGKLSPSDELDDGDRIHVRSITLSSNRLGLIARLDLLEAEDGCVTPVEAATRNAIDGLRLIAGGGTIPAPLVDRPKCPRCSRCLSSCSGEHLRDLSGAARTDVARDSGELAQLRRLVCRAHDRHRAQERRVADRAVSTVRSLLAAGVERSAELRGRGVFAAFSAARVSGDGGKLSFAPTEER